MLDLDKSKKYLLACSYGPDSMALFGMLLKEGFTFQVAHVNYHKRDISNYEEQALKDYCQKHNITCEILDTNTLKPCKGNFQAWARDVRYKFFADVCKEHGLDYVLVAHHLDDLLETYIMQTRRAGLVDYFGIKKETVIKECKVLRPLLNFTKKELNDYCKDNHIPFSLDVSNMSDCYTRNKIRHEKIEKMDIKAKHALKEEIDTKNIYLLEIKDKIENVMQGNYVPVEFLVNLETKELAIALNYYLAKNGIAKRLSMRNIREIEKAIKSNKPYLKLIINKKYSLIRDYKFIIIAENVEMEDYIFYMEAPGILDTDYFCLDISKNYEQFRISKDDFPLIIRNVRPGDMSYINNIPKKVHRLFIDWKMPRDLRDKWPLIFDKNEKLVYIIRYNGELSLTKHKDFIVKN